MRALEEYTAASRDKTWQLLNAVKPLQTQNKQGEILVFKFSPRYFVLNLFLVTVCVAIFAWLFWQISRLTFVLWCIFGLLAFYFLVLDELLVITLSATEMSVYRYGRLRQRFQLKDYRTVEYSVKKSFIQSRLRLILGTEEVDCSSLKYTDFMTLRDEVIRRLQNTHA